MMTQYDVEILKQFVIRDCAKFLKIKDPEWKGSFELMEEIAAANTELHNKIVDFLNVYQDWFTTTDCMRTKGGAENDTEREVLLQKATSRDEKRSILLAALGR